MKIHFAPNYIYVQDIDRYGGFIGQSYNHCMQLLQKVEKPGWRYTCIQKWLYICVCICYSLIVAYLLLHVLGILFSVCFVSSSLSSSLCISVSFSACFSALFIAHFLVLFFDLACKVPLCFFTLICTLHNPSPWFYVHTDWANLFTIQTVLICGFITSLIVTLK